MNLTTFGLYVAVSSLAVSFAHFLIGSSKCVLLLHLIFSIFAFHLYFNTRRLMNLTKNNLKNLGPYLGQLVRLVPVLVDYCVA